MRAARPNNGVDLRMRSVSQAWKRKPLTPPDGINFGGRLALMQGIITAPNGDVWALGVSKRQLLHFPKDDWNNGRIVCEGDSAKPCKSFTAPFHLAIDQQDLI